MTTQVIDHILRFDIIITSLAKEVMFLVALFVCLSVDNITQNFINRLG